MTSIAPQADPAKAGARFAEVLLGAAPLAPISLPSASTEVPESLVLQIRAVPASVHSVRKTSAAWINSTRTTVDLDDAMLVLSELVTNAMTAAPGLMLLVKARVDGSGDLVFEIWDPSPPPAALTPRHAALEAEGGRGLWLASDLAELTLVPVPDGTLVRAYMAAAA
jgi:anti-sigma regulatory factor (Ser/Thr protein kinase)